jgi:hypothetical protein
MSVAALEPVKIVSPDLLSQVARALTARLKSAFPTTRFQHDFMPPKPSQKEWGKLMSRTPFVGLGWNNVKQNAPDSRLFDGVGAWSVFLVAKNLTPGSRYYGDAQGPGLFQMVTAAIALLNGFVIPDIGACLVINASNAFAEGWEDDSAIAIIDLAVGTTISVSDALTAPADLGDFEQLAITWDWDGSLTPEPEINEVPQ